MISVIIATYGDQEWKTLAAERAQPSVDNQHEFAEVIRAHLPDGNIAEARNDGARRSFRRWLCFLDADDELAPGYLGAMRRAAYEQHGDGNVLLTPAVQQIRGGRPPAPGFLKEVPLEEGNWLVIGTMIHRELFDQIGGFHDHPHGLEDWNLWARAVRAGATIVKVPDAVYRAHWNGRSKHHQLRRGRNRAEYQRAYEIARQDAWG